MATREENIKKLNDKLEQLSDEELEQIAGGSWWQDIKDEDSIRRPAIIGANYNPK